MLKIYRHVPQSIVQKFGDNLPCCKLGANGKPIVPYVTDITTPNACPIGYTKYYQALNQKGHNGDDFASPVGTPVYLGVETEYPDMDWLVLTSYNDISGNIAIVVSTRPISIAEPKEQGSLNLIHKEYVKLGGVLHVGFRFAHMKSIVPNGTIIKQGGFVGISGATGAISGAHLHAGLAIHQSSGLGFSLDGDNGYNGCIDTKPYFIDVYWGDRNKYLGLVKQLESLKLIFAALLKSMGRTV